jgi:aspartate aminotransferase
MAPELSRHFARREPSAIRLSQIEFMKRNEDVIAVNTAIGNVSLPTHPAMQKRMFNLNSEVSPFKTGTIKYTSTVGLEETNRAFLNIIESGGFDTDNLYSQITDGGSQAMELLIVGLCGAAGSDEKPLLLIDAAYTNYNAMAERVGRKTVSVTRTLDESGKFSLPDIKEIERTIEKHKPAAMVVIPYDNPTGHFYNIKTMKLLASLCVKYDMWMISDEAYRELFYTNEQVSSIWGIDDSMVTAIEGRRISIETASKVWNACGLRIGALITDNQLLHQKAVAENTANLCSNAIGQYIFGALAHLSHTELNKWYENLRSYYKPMMVNFKTEMEKLVPNIIVSSPDASIYSVVDVRNIAKEGFNARDFVMYCAKKGKVEIEGKYYTLLVAPMAGFYSVKKGEKNPGITQMRIAYVPKKEEMEKVPYLFAELFKQFELQR